MILDLPPELETIIIQTAEQQGISAEQVATNGLKQLFLPNDELYFDIEQMKIAMQGLETPEDRLKNTVEIPKSALKDLTTFKQFLHESFA
ncbi:MAG: hypothetical protein Q4B79_08790 [Moraxella sp.]|uniref:hypothetical protein n=1 Tax=Moraxella sp. TaxID=479 RepID=UPI0026DDAAE1|nr:hypothetical protein [Moraxella sp.]MDO4451035.1 hypothetical protein [Moraxella sp.]